MMNWAFFLVAPQQASTVVSTSPKLVGLTVPQEEAYPRSGPGSYGAAALFLPA